MSQRDEGRARVTIREAALHFVLAEKDINIHSLLDEPGLKATGNCRDESLSKIAEAIAWLGEFIPSGLSARPEPYLYILTGLSE
ncbi:hypothetical protein RAC65_22105 [Pantoea sp. BS_8]|uniref:hypothetical protein n=1 Tax=Pantoea sp. BS_8 TaxID=3055781 RepID=UPI0035C1547E